MPSNYTITIHAYKYFINKFVFINVLPATN